MSKSERELVSAGRLVLQNPYAHIEQLDELDGLVERLDAHSRPLDSRVARSRKLYENQYAHLDEIEVATTSKVRQRPAATSRVAPTREAKSRSRSASGSLSDEQIKAKVRELHRRIWRERATLWDGEPPSSHIDLLDPRIALKLLGYATSIEVGLGQYETPGGMIEVAGLIDSTSRTVRISGQYPLTVQTFTTAHELAHAVLHPASSGVHRDRPLDGSAVSRDQREIEADKFATVFLMPEKLVRSTFVDMFGPAPFRLNEQTGYALFGDRFTEVLPRCSTRRELSRQLSGAKHYNGRQITSLADLFHVSVAAMAIRLEELDLVIAPDQD